MGAGRVRGVCRVMQGIVLVSNRFGKRWEIAAKRGVAYLTLFAFSSENWNRPREEVSRLMSLFLEALQREVRELHRNECTSHVYRRA